MSLTPKLVAALSLLLGGCVASDYRPPVEPTESVAGGAHYERDMAHCQSWAAQNDPRNQALAEAFAGAILGAAIGSMASPGGRSSGDRAIVQGALRGARPGLEAAQHAGGGLHWQQATISNCMSAMGYEVSGGGITMARLVKETKGPFMSKYPTDTKKSRCKVGYESGYVDSEEVCSQVHGVVLYY